MTEEQKTTPVPTVQIMTEEQKTKCKVIIHSHAVLCAGGNAVPAPGVGLAADITTMVSMAVQLAGVFGGDITKEAAKGLAVAALKKTALQQPIRVIAKELSKFIPGLGQVVAPTVGFGMAEAAGWAIANDLARKANKTS